MVDYTAVVQNLTLVNTTLILFGAGIGYIVLTSIYNVLLHPLRKFPGPKLAGATGLYIFYYKYYGQQHTAVKRLHDEYGEVVRVGPNQLSFIGETAWKDIYAYRGKDRSQMSKGDGRGPQSKPPYHIMNAPDHVHAFQRKVLSAPFSERALRENESLLVGYVNQLADIVREHANRGTPLDIAKYFDYTTSDIISDFCFMESYGQLKSGKQEPLIAAIHRLMPIEAKINLLPTPLAIFLLFRIMGSGQLKLLARSTQEVETRLRMNIDKKDVMQRMIGHISQDGEGLTMQELTLNSLILLMAGSETTATTLSGAMYFLLKNKATWSKLVDEVRSQIKSASDLSIDEVARMPYLNAVIEESLRLYSPVPVALNRITPAGGASISGHWVPGNITVGIAHYAAFRSSSNFGDASAFRPERWTPTRGEEFENDKPAVFQPFSAGPRNCLGTSLAYAELRLILARLAFEFDFALVDKKRAWDEQQAHMLYLKSPLMLHVRSRFQQQ